MLCMKRSNDDDRLLQPVRQRWCSTVGSNLHSLTVTSTQAACNGFLMALSMSKVDAEDCKHLAKCIS
jgi:hypothetical protein